MPDTSIFNIKASVRRLVADETGGAFVEFLIIIGFVALVVMVGYTMLGEAVTKKTGESGDYVDVNLNEIPVRK